MSDAFDPSRIGPKAFTHDVEPLTVIETHISWVFLTGEFAYKVKKPVDLGFVDFRTLDARRFFCDRELELNRAMAPELYLAVVPIGGSSRAPRFGAEPAFEYAVQMRQFPQQALLDQRFREGRFSIDDAKLVGNYVADVHEHAAGAPPDARFGKVPTIAGPIFDNYRALDKQNLPDEVRARIDACCQRDVSSLRRLRPTLSRRRREGYTRDCHGDLHLANMIKLDGAIRAFDRLEFDDELRFIDVINEAAFPFMDLLNRCRADLAYEYLDAYLTRTGDYLGLALLPLYARYKAMIRAKVTALHGGLNEGEKLAQVSGHVNCAMQLFGVSRPCLILMRGLSRSGKSWLSSHLKRALPAVRLRADVERKRLAGLAPSQSSGSGVGQDLYSAERTRQTYETLLHIAGVILKAGFHVIVDATFLKSWQRQLFLDGTEETDSPAVIVDCQAPVSLLRERIRSASRDDPSEASERVLDWQIKNAEPLSADEQAITIGVDTSEDTDIVALVHTIRGRLTA